MHFFSNQTEKLQVKESSEIKLSYRIQGVTKPNPFNIERRKNHRR
jgi:hypothetical protein